MKLHEIISPVTAEDSGLNELWASLIERLKKSQAELSKKAGAQSSHNIGGNLSAAVSGKVALVKNYSDYSRYSGTHVWDYALQVGNNLKGSKAIDEITKLFNNLLQEVKGYELKKLEAHNDVFHAYFNDGSISCKYEYASSFCWLAIRKK
jgi:hypothetical protein